ncbi:hypothetical protein PHLCEN_2v3491 [Hermanssonia centrifuga]|uniref:Peptidase A1 domain-containing protein n=1 Tax=Hermanssonia centrifuga TaxID=98765 RepID=A0A2R6QF11_9APHY|nr:hypothetical protein PHLCEN_2v3491 [Hermanssonia centrifuga]
MRAVQGEGQASGYIVEDVVSMGSLTVEKQQFIAVQTTSDSFLDEPSDGLLGMAFGSIARIHAPTFFENLLSGYKLASGIFSIYVTRGKEDGSEV